MQANTPQQHARTQSTHAVMPASPCAVGKGEPPHAPAERMRRRGHNWRKDRPLPSGRGYAAPQFQQKLPSTTRDKHSIRRKCVRPTLPNAMPNTQCVSVFFPGLDFGSAGGDGGEHAPQGCQPHLARQRQQPSARASHGNVTACLRGYPQHLARQRLQPSALA